MADKHKRIRLTKWRPPILLVSALLFIVSIVNIGNFFGQIILIISFILFEIWFFSHK